MTLTFDPRYNIAYIKLREKTGDVDSIRISDELVIDTSADGKIFGIELLNANAQLKDKEALHLLFVNEATGEQREINI